ncbi:MAG TPA: SoxR reducing system RseC family protein [Gammaproteobacteria bacterium]
MSPRASEPNELRPGGILRTGGGPTPAWRCLTAPGVVAAAADGVVEIELDERARCQGCRGACLWGRPDASRARLRTELELGVGDRVRVSMPHRYLLLAALLLHGLPLAGLLGGAVAGLAATGGDGGAVAGAVAGVALVVAGARRAARRVEALALRHLVLERAA